MKLTQIRNATNKLSYNGITFLIDPWLMPKHQFSFVDIPGRPFHVPEPVKEQLPMPFYDLPLPVASILENVDAYIVTHLHPDHIDIAPDGSVGAPLDKHLPLFCQNEADAAVLARSGFTDIRVLTSAPTKFSGITLHKTECCHGTFSPCGEAMGVLFSHPQEPIFYIAGDTIWYDAVQRTLQTYMPDVIALNCCAAETVENGRLLMNDEDIECVQKTCPSAALYLTHLDTVAHAAITRYSLRGLLACRGITNYTIPLDGESIIY